uniref:Uncharacterized protein n=1 Tax=Anguilla anguilla TaxID=7936 RepID=A0A0E9W7S9_ANGAN
MNYFFNLLFFTEAFHFMPLCHDVIS